MPSLARALPRPSVAMTRLGRRRAERTRWSPLTVVLCGVLLLVVVPCLFAPLVAPFDPSALSATRFAGPSLHHLFGTDELGRDLASRILYGGRLTVLICAGATAIAMVLGAIWGMVAAYFRGLLDEILMRIADAAMAIPQILFALVFVAAFGANAVRLAVIVGILLTPTTARLVRSATLVETQSDYFSAAIAYGAPRYALLAREVFPNLRAPLAVQAAINAANAVILEAALSFVGLGIQPPEASLGSLVRQGYDQIYQSVTYVLFPTVIIFVVIWMLTLLADQLSGGEASRGVNGG